MAVTGRAAGFDGITVGDVGWDDGAGNLSVTVPVITAGPERESGWEGKAGLVSLDITICGLGVTASLPGAPGIGKFSL